MVRITLFIMSIFLSLNIVFANNTDTATTSADTIKETSPIKGTIHYDDSPVETIYLDEDVEKPQINIHKRSLTLPVKMLNITSNSDSTRSALARAITARPTMSDILPLSGTISDSFGGFSYGQTWGQEILYGQLEDTTSFFIRYDSAKYFSLATSIRQSSTQDVGTQYNVLRITPEWHITDRLTLKDAYSSYINVPKNKNELRLVYTPALSKYADCLKFELGIAQSYYRNGRQSSAMTFTTGFKL